MYIDTDLSTLIESASLIIQSLQTINTIEMKYSPESEMQYECKERPVSKSAT